MTPEGKRLERAVRWGNTVVLLRKRVDEVAQMLRDLEADVRHELVTAKHAVQDAEAAERKENVLVGRG